MDEVQTESTNWTPEANYTTNWNGKDAFELGANILQQDGVSPILAQDGASPLTQQ